MANNAELISEQFPGSVEVNQPFQASIVLRNNGDTTWLKRIDTNTPSNPHNLGSQNPIDNFVFGSGSNRFFLTQDTPPGSQNEFVLNLIAPPNPGTYSCQWQMVQEFVGRFGPIVGPGILYVTGNAPETESNVVFPAPPVDPNDLVGAPIMNTQAYVMDNIARKLRWVNKTGRRLLIKKAYLWSGVGVDTRADVHAELYRVSDKTPLLFLQWDHYAEPTAPNNSIYQDYHPYIGLPPNDALELMYFGNSFSGVKMAHHGVFILAQYDPVI